MNSDDVTLLAREIRDSNKLSDNETEVLRNLEIQFSKAILPQHQIESRAGSRPPTREEIKQFKQYASLKRGCFHPLEDEQISDNWAKFCKIHDWNPQKFMPFLLLRVDNKTFIRSKKQRRKFVQFLAQGLPNRTLYSVYHRFRNLFAERVQRRFLPDEDKMILDHLENNANLDEKKKYSDLAEVLKRTRASIWRRYKLLKKKSVKDEPLV